MKICRKTVTWICMILCTVMLAGCTYSTTGQTDGTGESASEEVTASDVSGNGQDELDKDRLTGTETGNEAKDVIAAGSETEESVSPGVKLHFLCVTEDDTGCDVILIESGGEFGFVDCGLYADREQIMAIMDELGVTPENLKFIIGTHAHGDHIGLMDYLIYSYRPERVYLLPFSAGCLVNPNEWTDVSWKNAMNQADACGVPVVSAFLKGASEEPWTTVNPKNRYVASPHFTFGGAQIDIYNYSRDYLTEKVGNANDTSLVVKLTAGGHTALLTGDLSNAPGLGNDPGHDETMIANEIGHVDILKLPHHGSGFDDTILPEDMQKFSASYLIQTGPTHFLFTGKNEFGTQESFPEILREVKMGAVYVSTFWYDRRIIGEDGLGAITFDMDTLENNIPDTYSIMALDQDGRSYMFRGGRLADFNLDSGDVYISNGKKNEAGFIVADGIAYTINNESMIVGANGQKWEKFR